MWPRQNSKRFEQILQQHVSTVWLHGEAALQEKNNNLNLGFQVKNHKVEWITSPIIAFLFIFLPFNVLESHWRIWKIHVFFYVVCVNHIFLISDFLT